MIQQILLLGAYAIQVTMLTVFTAATRFLIRHEELLMLFFGLGWMVSLAFFIAGHALRNTRTKLIHIFCSVIFVPLMIFEMLGMVFAWAWSFSANFG